MHNTRLKAITQKNILWGMFNSLITLPFFIYGMAFVAYHEGKRKWDVEHYFFTLLAEPVVFSLFFLVVANTIVDFWVYRNHQRVNIKKCLMVLNVVYLLFIIVRQIDFCDRIEDGVILGIFLILLIYKLFRYHQYCRLVRSMVQAA